MTLAHKEAVADIWQCTKFDIGVMVGDIGLKSINFGASSWHITLASGETPVLDGLLSIQFELII
ncbi:MAG: hypothetical protein ABSH41_12880 [Syntrophobacteraceae bacterium]